MLSWLKSKFAKRPKVVFCNYGGMGGYACNPKYIAEEILRRKLPYELVWIVRDVEKERQHFPNEIRLVNITSKQAIAEHETADIWVDNHRKVFFMKRGLRKKPNQLYIQTWHGSIGIKKAYSDKASNTPDQTTLNWLKRDAEITDHLTINSQFDQDILAPSLMLADKTWMVGHPRNDIFFKSETEQLQIKQKVFKNLRINTGKRLALYCPTYRDDNQLHYYSLDTQAVAKALEAKFGGDWVVAVRLHPRLVRFSTELGDIVNASFYQDMQELLAASDIAISDYSSCLFDFMISKKPAFIFATDMESYNTERGLYYPLESTPFPVAATNDLLIQNILNFDNESYVKAVDEFLKSKGWKEDGTASAKVVDLIEKRTHQK